MGPLDLVTVYTTNNSVEAEVVKNFLEAEGIEAQVAGESQAGFAGVLDVPVLVPAADVDRARELIAVHEQQRGAHQTEEEEEEEEMEEGETETGEMA
jgi:hypothetical protein